MVILSVGRRFVKNQNIFIYTFYNGKFRGKVQSGPLNCNAEKVLYLLKCKVCGEALYVGKAKTKFRSSFNNYKNKHGAFIKGNQKIPQQFFHNHFFLSIYLGIDDWDFTLFEQCGINKQPQEREPFWQSHHQMLPIRS